MFVAPYTRIVPAASPMIGSMALIALIAVGVVVVLTIIWTLGVRARARRAEPPAQAPPTADPWQEAAKRLDDGSGDP